MSKSAGFLVDLSSVRLDESTDNPTSWIQGMTVGTYSHPLFGEIKITPERIQRFADSVNNKVRGIDLDIDYDHKATRQDAAGWIQQAEARPNGLFLLVEWTKEAAEKIKAKAYRYFSPEFDDEWTHPKSGVTFKDVMFGGGITNRPFLKDILPINLSEAFAADAQVDPNQGGLMDPKKLRELLGLPEDATDEQVSTALTAKLSEKKPEDEKPEGGDNKPGAGGVNQLSEEVIRLAEQSPAIKALVEQAAAQEKALAEVSTALRLSEVTNQVIQLNETAKGKGRAFPPAIADELKALFVKAPKAFADETLAIVTKLAETGFVPLGEKGNAGDRTNDGDAVKKFTDMVDAAMKADTKLEYADAVMKVASENPQAFDEYRQASYAFREN